MGAMNRGGDEQRLQGRSDSLSYTITRNYLGAARNSGGGSERLWEVDATKADYCGHDAVAARRDAVEPEALAERADIHRTHVGLIERGKRSVSVEIAVRIASALHTTLASLVGEAEREWGKGRSPS